MASEVGIEKRIIIAAAVFVLALTGVIALSVRAFGVNVPTCLTDVRPFKEAKVVEQSPNHYEVHFVAKMWAFDPPEIAIKPGSTVDFYVATADVTHGMQIVGTNVNLMAVPGAVNYIRAKFDREGDYLVVCNEYCGRAHHDMAGRIHVSQSAVAAAEAAKAKPVEGGTALLDQYGCTACHSTDGSQSVGPTFKGLYGSMRVLTNGSTVKADDHYLEEAIEEPGEQVVNGFDAMPEMPVPKQDVQKIIDYIKTLK